MSTFIHFIDVGQGNMVLIQSADGSVFLYDCNVTDDNEERVLEYLSSVLSRSKIDVFINSHREADHMRGIRKVHQSFQVQEVWDSGVTGTTTDSDEYLEYMELRREVGFRVVEAQKRWDYGATRLRIMNSKNDSLPDDPNAQSIVLKVEHRDLTTGTVLSSAMLTGDTDAQAWRVAVVPAYSVDDLRSTILLASHHGAITFFDDPADEKNYYVEHIKLIRPEMTVISVGPNGYGHPDPKALSLYERYSSGSNKGNKISRTDEKGTRKLTLQDPGSWNLS